MGKKFVPTEEQLEILIDSYQETNNYTKAGSSIGISGAVAKRVLTEALELESRGKPYTYEGEEPHETKLPTKHQFYYDFIVMMKEIYNVPD